MLFALVHGTTQGPDGFPHERTKSVKHGSSVNARFLGALLIVASGCGGDFTQTGKVVRVNADQFCLQFYENSNASCLPATSFASFSTLRIGDCVKVSYKGESSRIYATRPVPCPPGP